MYSHNSHFFLSYFQELTGTEDGIRLLISRPEIIVACSKLIRDSEIYTAKDAMRILVNISSEHYGAEALLGLDGILQDMLKVRKKRLNNIAYKEFLNSICHWNPTLNAAGSPPVYRR